MLTYSQLEYSEAEELLDYIVEQAGEKKVAICVIDTRGNILTVACINGVGQHYLNFAVAKARTALDEGQDTVHFRFARNPAGMWGIPAEGAWSEWEITHAAQLSSHFCGWAGGTLVLNPADGSTIGAIGVSGLLELADHALASERPSGWTA